MNRNPRLIVVSGLLLWSFAALLVWYSVQQLPFLGVDFAVVDNQKHVEVTEVISNGPADQAGLKVGMKIVSVLNPSTGELLALVDSIRLKARDKRNTHAAENLHRDQLEVLWPVLSKDRVSFILDTGTKIDVSPTKVRALKWESYFGLFLSLLVIVVTLGILAFAKLSKTNRLLVFVGFSLSGVCLINSLWPNIGLAAPPQLQIPLTILAYLALVLFCYGLLALMWRVPRPISGFPFASASLALGGLCGLLNETQILEFPLHTYQFPLVLTFPAAIIISVVQYRRTAKRPLDRAALRWFMLSIYCVIATVLVLFSVPVLLSQTPILTVSTASFLLTLIFFGFALGTLRYRLFDINRHWLQAVFWITGGLLVLCFDILLVTQLDLSKATSLAISLVLAGWIYFPARQALFAKFADHADISIAKTISELVSVFSRIDQLDEFDGRLIGFMQRLFKTASISPARGLKTSTAQISQSGLVLQIPYPMSEGCFELSGKRGGRSLFTPSDTDLSNMILGLVQSIVDARVLKDQELQGTKTNIVQDLHDHVGGHLLDLIYLSPDEKTRHSARLALSALKDSLMVIEDAEVLDLDIALETLLLDTKDRLEAHGLQLVLKRSPLAGHSLNASEYVDLKWLLHELSSNAIKYALKEEPISIVVEPFDDEGFRICQSNICKKMQSSDTLTKRRGLANLESRARRLGGKFEFKTLIDDEETNTFKACLEIPFQS